MRHREIRLIGSLRGNGELFEAGSSLGPVRYELEESEHVVLTQGPAGPERAPAYREIQGSLRSLDGTKLLDRGELCLHLHDGRQVLVTVLPPHHRSLARSSFSVKQVGVLLPTKDVPSA